MAEVPEQRATLLEGLALLQFTDLSRAEVRLLRAAPNGGFAVCGTSSEYDDPTNDPAEGDKWGAERQLRSELIRWLCVDFAATMLVDPRGVSILAARVVGALDLSFASIAFPLRLVSCLLNDAADLTQFRIPALDLRGSRTRQIKANGADITGAALLSRSFSAEGEVGLLCARIGGNLDCSGGSFKNPGGNALVLESARVGAGVFLCDGFVAEGSVRLLGAEIGGNLQCHGGYFRNPSGDALSGDRARVAGSVVFGDRFRADGGVRLLGAQIGNSLECSGGSFRSLKGVALFADGANVRGDVVLGEGFVAEGEVRLRGAQIGSNFNCDGGTFKNPNGDALFAAGAKVSGDVSLGNGFNAEGPVRLRGAQIAGSINCGGGTFKSGSGDALSADRLNVGGSIFLRDKFSAEGEVRMLGAQIGNNLDCRGGTFKNPSGYALAADHLNAAGSVFLRRGFSAKGEVRLAGAQIGNNLDCRGGTFNSLVAIRAGIKGCLLWRGVLESEQAKINLEDASVVTIIDEKKSWPHSGNLKLDGLVYARVAVGPTDARSRLDWLDRQVRFTLQPYRQLADVLRTTGDNRGARYVLFEMERRHRRERDQDWYSRLWSWILRITIGYGLYPWWALWCLAILTLAGFLLFGLGYVGGTITPAEHEAYTAFQVYGSPPSYYPGFNALAYSFEHSFPLVNLGQKDRWAPNPEPPGRTPAIQWRLLRQAYDAEVVVSVLLRATQSARFLQWCLWIQIVLGWILATLFAAGLAGIVRSS